MIEFINTNKNLKTKLDKTLSEDIIKIRHGFCHLRSEVRSKSISNLLSISSTCPPAKYYNGLFRGIFLSYRKETRW